MIPDLFWLAAAKLTPYIALAEAPGDTKEKSPVSITLFDPLKGMTLMDLLEKVISGLTALAIPVVTVMILIGAFYIITSGGNPGRRTKGKDYILWSAIGFAILLLASSVVAILQDFLGS